MSSSSSSWSKSSGVLISSGAGASSIPLGSTPGAQPVGGPTQHLGGLRREPGQEPQHDPGLLGEEGERGAHPAPGSAVARIRPAGVVGGLRGRAEVLEAVGEALDALDGAVRGRREDPARDHREHAPGGVGHHLSGQVAGGRVCGRAGGCHRTRR
jgi:hypothetical protein